LEFLNGVNQRERIINWLYSRKIMTYQCRYRLSSNIHCEPPGVEIQGKGNSRCTVIQPSVITNCLGRLVDCCYKDNPRVQEEVKKIKDDLIRQEIQIKKELQELIDGFGSPYR
tara:strand:- start:899 stop:1237 length:339 start_codon:yes stop_codon:yes gene_type:complete